MNNFIEQIFALLISPPGNLVYHLILAFAVVASLQAALIYWRRAPGPARRVSLGLGMVLAAQLVLFASSGLAWQQIAEPQRLLPAVDRAVVAFSLLWIAWLWCAPKSARLPDALVGLLSLGIVVAALFTVSFWLEQDPSVAFNDSVLDWAWNLASLSLAAIAMLLLLVFRPANWETGFSMLGLMLAGFVAHLLLVTPDGNFSGIIRLAQLCAYPLLPAVANRLNHIEVHRREKPAPPPLPAPKEDINLRSRLSWMQLAAENDEQRIYTSLTRAVAQMLRADLCLLLAAPGLDQNWTLRGGCDLVGDQPLTGLSFDSLSIPAVANQLQRSKTVILPAPGVSTDDLVVIGRSLGLDDAGSLLAVPLVSNGKVWGGIVLLSPYTTRTWSDAEKNLLQTDAETLMQIVQRAERSTRNLPMETQQPEPARLDNQALLQPTELNPIALRAEIIGGNGQSELKAAPQAAQELISALQAENETLKEQLRLAPLRESPSTELAQTQAELRITLEEIALLQNALAKADMRIKALEHGGRSQVVVQPQNNDLLIAIAQELRQPMSSVTGYCDLLLAESAGQVTTLQRSFLERVRASTERMQTIMDDLVHVATSGGGRATPALPVELNDLVDQAISNNSAVLRQKNLTLRVDLPDQMPTLRLYPSALRQILVNLVRNAASVSPDGTTITLRAALEDGGRLALRIRDSGGGIPDVQLGDVFNARYKAGQPLVEGVADSGFGLAVTRELVVAQGGEIQVESEPGKSSTFVVRIPLSEDGAVPARVE